MVRDPGIMWEHGHLQGKLFRYLDEWMEDFGQGMVSVDCGCILAEDPDTVRFPDVAVLLRQSARDWLHGAPDVAIEVLSPSNTPQGIREKTQDYFDAGALRVWIVDPKGAHGRDPAARTAPRRFSGIRIAWRIRKYCPVLRWRWGCCSGGCENH